MAWYSVKAKGRLYLYFTMNTYRWIVDMTTDILILDTRRR
jgi:hypothetical protein